MRVNMYGRSKLLLTLYTLSVQKCKSLRLDHRYVRTYFANTLIMVSLNNYQRDRNLSRVAHFVKRIKKFFLPTYNRTAKSAVSVGFLKIWPFVKFNWGALSLQTYWRKILRTQEFFYICDLSFTWT